MAEPTSTLPADLADFDISPTASSGEPAVTPAVESSSDRAPRPSSNTLASVAEAFARAEKETAAKENPPEATESADTVGDDKSKADRARDGKGKFAPTATEAADKKPAPAKAGETLKPAGDAKATGKDKPAATEGDDDSDEAVEKFKPHKGAHPKTVEIIDKLKAQSKDRGQRNRELKQKLGEYETQIAEASKGAPLGTEERAELERLREFEFIQNPERSSKITREFDTKLASANEATYPLLKAHGMPETRAEAERIAKASGDPNAKPGMSLEELKSRGGIGALPFEWWDKAVLNNPNIDSRTRAKMSRLVNEFFDTRDARAEAIGTAASKRETFEATLKEQEQKEAKAFEGEIVNELAKIQDEWGEWTKPKVVPADATAEQRREIEAHNAVYEKYKETVIESHKQIFTGGAKGLATVLANVAKGARDAAELERVKTETAQTIQALTKRAEEAEGKLSQIKSAGKVSRLGGNATPKPVPVAPASGPAAIAATWNKVMAEEPAGV